MADSRSRSASLAEPLTEREQEILTCLVEGLSNREIADRLFLSPSTVKWYNSQIYSKLGVSKREAAVDRAQALGLVGSTPERPPPDTRHNLAAQTTAFIGRQDELAAIAGLLADPDTRLLTILAPGGMGKTRLALAAAEGELRHFADGVFFVPLAPLGSPDNIVTAVADHVGFTFYGSDLPTKQLLDYFREREILLVMDNFEHLLDGATLVGEMLQAAPRVKVLVTSREKLNLSGETVFTLSGLHFPDWETPEDALDYDAVKLFMQSAQRVRPDFALQADDLTYLARICRLTGGMPLGIVLAAGWLDVMSLERIAGEIQQGIDILETDMRDVPDRQRSVRATFNYSWARLSEAEQEVFMKLSVFRGGFTSEAARMVAGADVRLLRRLVSKALVQALPDDRYEIHELLRQYGESQLNESDVAIAVQAAHSAFFMNFLARRETDVKGRRQVAALQEISADFENIRKAWLWSLRYERFDALDRALECLAIAGELMGRLPDTRSILKQSADSLTFHVPVLWERVTVRLTRLNYTVRNVANFELVEAILGRARERNDVLEIVWCLWILAEREAMINGRDQLAQPLYEELVALCRTARDDYYLAHGLVGLSWRRYANSGDVLGAVGCLREAIAVRQKAGDMKNLDFATVQLSWMTFDVLKDAETAEALLDEQITMQRRTGTISFLPLLLGLKGVMTFWRNDVDAALKLAQEGLDTSQNQNYLGGRSMCLGTLGLIQNYYGNYKQAQLFCQEVVSLGFSNLTAFLSHWGLSLAYYGLGDRTSARRSLADALDIACRYRSPTFQSMGLLLMAVVSLSRSDPQRAIEFIAFNCSQPPHIVGWLHKWPLLNDLCAELKTSLGLDDYARVWERGKSLDLEIVITEVVAGFEDTEAK